MMSTVYILFASSWAIAPQSQSTHTLDSILWVSLCVVSRKSKLKLCNNCASAKTGDPDYGSVIC